MTQIDPGLQRARAAKARAKQRFSRYGNVSGIGVTRIAGVYGIKVNLACAPTTEKLPTEIDGVPVKVEVVGRIRKRAHTP
jgi:hypothetical protein